jgi:hypothetical protein
MRCALPDASLRYHRRAPVTGHSRFRNAQHARKIQDATTSGRCCAGGRAMPLRIGARPEACREYLGRQRPFDALVPPHPSPLPWGEGESSAACPQTQRLRNVRETDCEAPLSPRERAGVRGKGAIGLRYRVKTSFAPPTTFQILVALPVPGRSRFRNAQHARKIQDAASRR